MNELYVSSYIRIENNEMRQYITDKTSIISVFYEDIW